VISISHGLLNLQTTMPSAISRFVMLMLCQLPSLSVHDSAVRTKYLYLKFIWKGKINKPCEVEITKLGLRSTTSQLYSEIRSQFLENFTFTIYCLSLISNWHDNFNFVYAKYFTEPVFWHENFFFISFIEFFLI
jgi:hypothetical protein